MPQTISYMDKALGVLPAADHNSGTAQPAQGTVPANTCVSDAYTATVEAKITLGAATPLATGDILVALPLPAGHVPVDCYLTADAIDTGTSLTLTVAQLLQDFTDIVANTNLITASTVGQAGGVARAAVAGGLRLPSVAYDRWIGVKVAAGAAGVNAATVLSLVMSYRASNGD